MFKKIMTTFLVISIVMPIGASARHRRGHGNGSRNGAAQHAQSAQDARMAGILGVLIKLIKSMADQNALTKAVMEGVTVSGGGFGDLRGDIFRTLQDRTEEAALDKIKRLASNNAQRTNDLNNYFANTPSGTTSARYDYAMTTSTALMDAEKTYASLGPSVKRIEELNRKIDGTANVKEATDLNTRMMSEMAALSTEVMRMLALQNQQQSREHQVELESLAKHMKFHEIKHLEVSQ